MNAEACGYANNGGACIDTCSYVSVDFSEPLPAADLELEVTTSNGDELTPTTDDSARRDTPALQVNSNADGSQALGFKIAMSARQDFSPEWVDVVVRNGDHLAADSRLSLTYSCVPLNCNWCWKAKTVSLEVTTP